MVFSILYFKISKLSTLWNRYVNQDYKYETIVDLLLVYSFLSLKKKKNVGSFQNYEDDK